MTDPGSAPGSNPGSDPGSAPGSDPGTGPPGGRAHWDGIFATKGEGDLSWFQAQPAPSVDRLVRWADPERPLVDVGAGTSSLVDRLLDRGWRDITLVDVAPTALRAVRDRLGSRASLVTCVTGDVRTWAPDRSFGAWHDRAAFHFLLDDADRARYVATATSAVEPGGVVVLATFAPDGPETCSGLPVRRAGPDELGELFGGGFELVQSDGIVHVTPWGTEQPFTWVVLRRR